jgi:hypothetical protein
LSTMPSVALPHAYYEEVLTARYAEAVTEVNRKRDGRLNTKFYAEIGDAVFHAGCAALVDHHNGDKRLLTLSAPAGSGKTSFSYALIAGITREADDNPEAPYGCVFVTDQITKADDAYLMQWLYGPVSMIPLLRRGRSSPRLAENPPHAFLRPHFRITPSLLLRISSF